MCIPKVPKPPLPPLPPSRNAADDAADALRRRLAVRKGYAASVKSGPSGALDFGKNSQIPGLSAGGASVTGVA